LYYSSLKGVPQRHREGRGREGSRRSVSITEFGHRDALKKASLSFRPNRPVTVLSFFSRQGFLTDSGIVNLSRVQLIMTELGKMEDNIFKERQRRELDFRARNKAKRRRERMEGQRQPRWMTEGQFAPQALGGGRRGGMEAVTNAKEQAYQMRREGMAAMANADQNRSAAKALKDMLKSGGDVTKANTAPEAASSDNGQGFAPRWQQQQQQQQNSRKRKHENSDSEEEPPDEVRLYEDGFKDRYYESKFGTMPGDVDFRQRVAREYTIGLCWVLRYYYQGCGSWKWYFPYHYAPFASDFVGVNHMNVEFEKLTKPFNPLEQLMGVFPAVSRT